VCFLLRHGWCPPLTALRTAQAGARRAGRRAGRRRRGHPVPAQGGAGPGGGGRRRRRQRLPLQRRGAALAGGRGRVPAARARREPPSVAPQTARRGATQPGWRSRAPARMRVEARGSRRACVPEVEIACCEKRHVDIFIDPLNALWNPLLTVPWRIQLFVRERASIHLVLWFQSCP